MSKVKDLLLELDDERILDEVRSEIDNGVSPEDILLQCQEGMVAIGDEFDKKNLFVSDLMMAGAIFESVSEILLPLLKKGESEKKGVKVVIGTVKNDIHDIGKDIVSNMLIASGFDVIDLGVDVSPEDFVKALVDNDAKILAMSCLLVSCYDSILATVKALEDAGIRDKIKVIIGGGPVDEHVVKYSKADAFGEGPQDAIKFCEEA